MRSLQLALLPALESLSPSIHPEGRAPSEAARRKASANASLWPAQCFTGDGAALRDRPGRDAGVLPWNHPALRLLESSSLAGRLGGALAKEIAEAS